MLLLGRPRPACLSWLTISRNLSSSSQSSPRLYQLKYVIVLVTPFTVNLVHLQDWAGVNITYLQPNFKILTTKRIKAVMMNKSDVDSHVDRLVKVSLALWRFLWRGHNLHMCQRPRV